MDKKKLSEADIRSKFITPALVEAGWDLHDQIREEVALTSGKTIVKGNKHHRGKAKQPINSVNRWMILLQRNSPYPATSGRRIVKNCVS
ncbi:hypothetical protein N9H39_09990 [Gammaproteobacteria bacterium]|nr:hypothetical protein [Gammaproteobacteria bacterium]